MNTREGKEKLIEERGHVLSHVRTLIPATNRAVSSGLHGHNLEGSKCMVTGLPALWLLLCFYYFHQGWLLANRP